LRKYSDIDATWGWNNLVKDFIFGYRYYQFVCSEQGHDLPIYLSIAPANTHEAVMSLKALERLRKHLRTSFPQSKITRLSVDAIHDAYAYYHYLIAHNILYAIPYANTPPKCSNINGKLVNHNGVPICPCGLPMRRMTLNRHGATIYGCPVKRFTNRKEGRNIQVIHRKECPRGTLCEPLSKWGPYVSIKPLDDPRLHPPIPRNSQEYRKLMNLRSGCERSNSMKKQNFNLKFTNSRVMPYVYIRTILISLLEHAYVWVKEKLKEIDLRRDILSLFQ
jgi:hypothetical protein